MNRAINPKEILEKYNAKLIKKRNLPFIRFIEKLKHADTILDHSCRYFKEKSATELGTDRKKIIEMIKQNFVVSIISELEIFLKAVIMEFHWENEAGYESLLKEARINLNDAYQMFSKKKVTREYIIATQYSFQSVNQVEKVFSALAGKDFLLAIETFKFFDDSTTNNPKTKENLKERLLRENIDWRKCLVNAYLLRHRIVHEGLAGEIPVKNVKDLGTMLAYFVVAVTFYCYSEHFRLNLVPANGGDPDDLDRMLKEYKPQGEQS